MYVQQSGFNDLLCQCSAFGVRVIAFFQTPFGTPSNKPGFGFTQLHCTCTFTPKCSRALHQFANPIDAHMIRANLPCHFFLDETINSTAHGPSPFTAPVRLLVPFSSPRATLLPHLNRYESPVRAVRFSGAFRLCLAGLSKANRHNFGRPPDGPAIPKL